MSRGMSIVLADQLTKSEAHESNPTSIFSNCGGCGFPNCGECAIAATLFDVHSGDEGIANVIGVMDDLIRQEPALAVMNHLVNFDDPSASII